MKTKMNETAMMMKMPPKVMKPTAKRSMRLTRLIRLAWPGPARGYWTGRRVAAGAAAAMVVIVLFLASCASCRPGAGFPRPGTTGNYSSLASSCLAISAGSGR